MVRHLLQNEAGLKIGLIVNDVAEVNIDAKLVRNSDPSQGAVDTVQLQNGCACCSKAEELLQSIGQRLLWRTESLKIRLWRSYNPRVGPRLNRER